jgi:hypothetical protein
MFPSINWMELYLMISTARTMWPLAEWLAANGISNSTFWYLKKTKPDNVPDTIKIGRRVFVTIDADEEFRGRRRHAARDEGRSQR